MTERCVIIGTRGSKLALEQTRRVQHVLGGASKQKIVRTSGDRFQDKALCEHDGIGLFTKEIEQELLVRRIDIAVHSLKDLPIKLAEGLTLGAIMRRDEASDLLIARPESLDASRTIPLKSGSVVGASSLRRKALLARYDPAITAQPIRGNVPTRLQKVVRGDVDAVILSRAGLSRLELEIQPLVAYDLNPDYWPGAAGQGTIAVECRLDDAEVLARLEPLDDRLTRICVQAERFLLATYGGGCHAPFGAWASLREKSFQIVLAAPDKHQAFNLAVFSAGSLERARDAAAAWIGLGCPERDDLEEIPWICRPARPWC